MHYAYHTSLLLLLRVLFSYMHMICTLFAFFVARGTVFLINPSPSVREGRLVVSFLEHMIHDREGGNTMGLLAFKEK